MEYFGNINIVRGGMHGSAAPFAAEDRAAIGDTGLVFGAGRGERYVFV